MLGVDSVERIGTIRIDEDSVLIVAWILWMRGSMVNIVGRENMVSNFSAGKLLNQSGNTSRSF